MTGALDLPTPEAALARITETMEPGEYPAAAPSLLTGRWVAAYSPIVMAGPPQNPDAGFRLGSDYLPTTAVASLVLDKQGGLIGTIMMNRGGANSEFFHAQGSVELRKNTRLKLIDGFLIIRIPSAETISKWYVVRRAQDELAFGAIFTVHGSEPPFLGLGHCVGGVLKKVPADMVL